ncbi:TPA: site-specific DNA-methyltransferase, partial [Mannheimia haemolytica]|nr:site-specific DNA-methyltransferase [Mannheimia haemolytica]
MLNWAGKSTAYQTLQTPTSKTLTPCEEESVDFENTQNIFIEGENLDVLKALQKSYFNSVKMIYIDPPYNTGNDFIYNDSFADTKADYAEKVGDVDEHGKLKRAFVRNSKENGHYHSNWLNMMLPRLHLAKNLLRDDGVIFISIDDNEQAQLKLLCDEVFGEENFVAILSVENNPKGRKNSKFISVSNDFCIIYAKNKEMGKFVENIPKNAKDMCQDENGHYVHASGKRVLVGENKFNQPVTDFTSDKHYSVYFNKLDDDIILKFEDSLDDKDLNLINQGYVRYISFFDDEFVENTYTRFKFLELFEDESLEFTEDKIYEKNFSDTIRMKSILNNKNYKAVSAGNLTNYTLDVKTTSAGTLLKELFETKLPVFSAPKNPNFLRHLITLFEDKNFISLDFFAGSSSF